MRAAGRRRLIDPHLLGTRVEEHGSELNCGRERAMWSCDAKVKVAAPS